MPKFYVVRKGKTPGIYTSWPECNAQIHGFSGAEFQSFATYDQAEKYFRETQYSAPMPQLPIQTYPLSSPAQLISSPLPAYPSPLPAYPLPLQPVYQPASFTALPDPRGKEFSEIKQRSETAMRDENVRIMKINHARELMDFIAETAQHKIALKRKHQAEMKQFYEICDQKFDSIKEKHKQELEKVNQITEVIDVTSRFRDLEVFINPNYPEKSFIDTED